MPVRTVIVVGPEFQRTETALLREASRFQRRVSTAAGRGVDRAYKPVLVGMVPAFMPSGYAPVLAPNLAVKSTVRFGGPRPGVGVTVSAPTGGTKGGRDVLALELGTLRHPLYGNKGFWYRQRVRRGFASVPLKAVRPQIVREIDHELAEVARDVERAA